MNPLIKPMLSERQEQENVTHVSVREGLRTTRRRNRNKNNVGGVREDR
jgi:hypothetical protein